MCIDDIAMFSAPVTVVVIAIEIAAGGLFLVEGAEDRGIISEPFWPNTDGPEIFRHGDCFLKSIDLFA